MNKPLRPAMSLVVVFALMSLACNRRESSDVEIAPEKKAKSIQEEKKPMEAQKPTPPEPKAVPAPSDVAAPPSDAIKSSTGLASKVVQAGTGTEHPGPEDRVTVHYSGWTKDGKMFDSSVVRDRPATFPLNGVIKGWTEGVQLMVEGEKRRFWIPGDLAYGEVPSRPGAPAGQLTFDVELLKIAKAPQAPKDVSAPPATAKKTASGLAYVELSPGKADGKKPTETSVVTVHYSGWTKDGKMFDSSESRGEPASFPLNGVIKGWTEGLQLMKEGAKFRFWIPGELAYGDKPMRPGAPAGQLTFDVELLGVQ